MSLIKRILYYLGGVGLGLILLMFFLSGKKTSCDYAPNSRTLKFLKNKPLSLSSDSKKDLIKYNIDSTRLARVLLEGDVNFSDSEISSELPNIYAISIDFDDLDEFVFRYKVKKDSTHLISVEPLDP